MMFAMQRMKCSITRNLARSGLWIAASFLLICFLCIYINGIWSNEQLLTSIGKQIPVSATITNLNGTREFGLSISTKYVDGFIDMGVVDPVLTAESYGNIDRGKLSTSSSGIISIYLIGTNSMDVFTFGKDNVTTGESLEFLAGDEPKCIMNSEYVSRNDLTIALGDVIDINLYKAKYDAYGSAFEFVKVAPARLTVAGFYACERANGVQNETPDIICPVSWLRQQYKTAGALFYYNSAKGTVAEPLLLNAFKEEAEALRFKQVNPQAGFSRTGNALLVSDKVFMETASQIMRNIQTLRLFLGPSIALTFLLVTLLSFFLSRSRRGEIFIAKCLGMKKRSILLELVLENCVLACIGGIIAAIVLLLASQISVSVYLLILLVFILCVLAGSLASTLILTHESPMKLMARVD
jgi:hypothetical protein